MSKLQRASLFIVAVIITIGVAYILGVAAAGVVQNMRAKKFRAEKTDAILEKMGSNLGIGRPLPDAVLQDLNGKEVRLRDVVQARSFISFISPKCGYCKMQTERLNEVVANPQDQTYFIYISDASREELIALRKEQKIQCLLYHDPKGTYKTKLGVFTFPFSMVVNKSLVIEDVITGAAEAGKLKDIVDFNHEI